MRPVELYPAQPTAWVWPFSFLFTMVLLTVSIWCRKFTNSTNCLLPGEFLWWCVVSLRVCTRLNSQQHLLSTHLCLCDCLTVGISPFSGSTFNQLYELECRRHNQRYHPRFWTTYYLRSYGTLLSRYCLIFDLTLTTRIWCCCIQLQSDRCERNTTDLIVNVVCCIYSVVTSVCFLRHLFQCCNPSTL